MPNAEFRYVTTRIYQSGSTPNQILAELPFTDVSYTSQLNSVGTFQGSVLLSGFNTTNQNVYDGTVPGKTILWVLYSDPLSNSSVPVWSGVIWAREYDSDSQTLSINAQEMMSLYSHRRISVTKDYGNTFYDPATIAYQLLQYTEGVTQGKTGLLYNSATTTYRTKKIYEAYELKSVYQAIKDLSANFFDFKITPLVSGGNLYNRFDIGLRNGTLGVAYSTSSLSAAVFQFPGNVIEYKFPEDASSAANKLYGIGYGANNTQLKAVYADTTRFADGFTLLEDTASYTDVADQQLLNDLTTGQLKAISYPPTTIEVVIAPYVDPLYPRGYLIGDQVRLDIRDSYFPNGVNFGATDPLRIVAISVAPGENGPSRVTLTLTRELSGGVS
jgi:hypothetical protein